MFEKMRNEKKVTKFKETKPKRKNNPVSEKKITKNFDFFFCLRRNMLFWEFESNPNKPNLAWPPKRNKISSRY
jgi:hypothetical protein